MAAPETMRRLREGDPSVQAHLAQKPSRQRGHSAATALGTAPPLSLSTNACKLGLSHPVLAHRASGALLLVAATCAGGRASHAWSSGKTCARQKTRPHAHLIGRKSTCRQPGSAHCAPISKSVWSEEEEDIGGPGCDREDMSQFRWFLRVHLWQHAPTKCHAPASASNPPCHNICVIRTLLPHKPAPLAPTASSCDQRSEPAQVRHVQVRGHVCHQSRNLARQRELVCADLLALGREEEMVCAVVRIHFRRDHAQDLRRDRRLSIQHEHAQGSRTSTVGRTS
jgi:hypothetical protein